ncbi:RHS domain-containing protein [Chromobacterium haemolyticum]|uniref:RHS domain-containing protein n=1 Tax=Chromobacterium haemolyticum TaxID=394935 RepID=UPI0015E793B9|nr:RHS domain-containing protein [Chromobacterium haemolyticum]
MYYYTDHLGTPLALTDEQGALALEMDYQAWGQAREIITDAVSKDPPPLSKASTKNPGCTTTITATMTWRLDGLFQGANWVGRNRLKYGTVKATQ